MLAGALSPALSQDYIVKTWGVDDGLPESSVSDVVQSRDGYLWVGTLNSGLSRFDGVRFVNFDLPSASRLSGGVRRLFIDDDGVLWINGFGNSVASLKSGLFRPEHADPVVINWLVQQKSNSVVFATKEGQLLERKQGDGTNCLWKIIHAESAGPNAHHFSDSQGCLWYRRTDGQLARLEGENARAVPLPSGATEATALTADKQGTIAVGTAEKVYVWANGRFEDLTPTNEEPGALSVRGLAPDGQGGWWVEANNRLRRCRDRQWIAEAAEWHQQNRNWSKVRWEQPDASGGLWLAYTDGGVVHVSATGKISEMTTHDGLPSNHVRTLTQDSEGDVWVTFERGGLARIRPRLFHALGRREGLADLVTTSVCEDKEGSIWIGTLSGVVSRLRDGVCSNFTLPLTGTHCEISTVCADPRGRVWIGTHGNGLLVYENGQVRPVLSIDQIGVNVRGIFADHESRVWIASQDGLYCLANGNVQRLQTPQSEVDYPTAVAEGTNGTIWVAMNTGYLLKIAEGKQESFQPARAPMRVRFTAVCQDTQGTVWIGTMGSGLLRFSDGKFKAITKQNGLPTDNISEVIQDDIGGLWLGSPAGIISVDKDILKSDSKKPACRIFGRDDGLPTVGCATASQPAAWCGHDGRIWFATAVGVASVLPHESEPRIKPPLVVVEDVLADGQLEASSMGAQALVATTPVKLAPGRHHVEFRFSGISFTAPERIRFKYTLEGMDDNWIENRSERTVSYALPPGNYRFRVMACNGDGVWSATEASVALVIPPHLWEARWFQVAALGAVLAMVAAAVFWTSQIRHRRELRALEQQQALERERTRIAQDIHDDLGASLTRITMLSQSALNKTATAPPPNSEVTRIYATARAMTNAMDEIVWAINPRHDSIESVAAYFAEFVEEFLSPTGLKFHLEIPLMLPPWTITAEVRHNLFLAFKEALNNVVKHSQASEVTVTLAVRPKGFVLSVEDNGRGFETGALAAVQTGPDRKTHGNGLANMRRRLEELGGRCTVDSVTGRGTRVSFEVDVH
jgi:signal transduction histidine kinase/ligand-binding sensor domain-containing protein